MYTVCSQHISFFTVATFLERFYFQSRRGSSYYEVRNMNMPSPRIVCENMQQDVVVGLFA